MNSIHDELERVRKPRIHIKYEVETEGATQQKELPFVTGVMGDFAGNNPGKELKPLRERKFIKIDRDNFNEVMENVTPGINIRVENTLANDGSEINVKLQFKSVEDFMPANIVNQIEPLRKLKHARDKLRELLTKTDCSDELEALLEHILKNSTELNQLAQQLELKRLEYKP